MVTLFLGQIVLSQIVARSFHSFRVKHFFGFLITLQLNNKERGIHTHDYRRRFARSLRKILTKLWNDLTIKKYNLAVAMDTHNLIILQCTCTTFKIH